MKRKTWSRLGMGIALALAVVVALSAGASTGHGVRDISAGTGYAALELCTRTLQSGEAFEHVRKQYVEPKTQPLSRIWQLDYRPGVAVRVSTRLPFLANERVAIFRAGLGCTIVPPGTSEAAVRAQPFRAAPELAPDPRGWPLGEGAVDSQLLSDAARQVIERHAAQIFDESAPDLQSKPNTTALLVARDGQLVFERYGQGYRREQPQLGWSMTKSLTAIIAGVLAREGKLQIDQPVGLQRWRATPKAAITWRQLLNMAPGLAWDEGYGGASDATQMLFSQPNEGAWAADRPSAAAPGAVFTYSTGFTNIAMLRMRELLGGSHQALYDFYQGQLFAPLGIRHGVIEPDASGTPVGGARGMLRPVDWLRLGQLIADRGSWQGQRILPADYVEFMTSASPASAGYGGFIWRGASDMIEARVRAKLPADLVWFAGHLGQYVVIVPSRRLVVLRMGVSPGTMRVDSARDRVFALASELLSTN
jgi:CubicO group peptidase (beta-lactamase class C family)